MKAPDLIWYDPESDTIVTEKKRVMDGDVEYIRNDADAMERAGWVPVEMVKSVIESELLAASPSAEDTDLRAQLAAARNDALEEAAVKVSFGFEEGRSDYGMSRNEAAKEIRAMKENEK